MQEGFVIHLEAVSWLKYQGYSGKKNNYYLPDYGHVSGEVELTDDREIIRPGAIVREAVIEKRDDGRYYVTITDALNKAQSEMVFSH